MVMNNFHQSRPEKGFHGGSGIKLTPGVSFAKNLAGLLPGQQLLVPACFHLFYLHFRLKKQRKNTERLLCNTSTLFLGKTANHCWSNHISDGLFAGRVTSLRKQTEMRSTNIWTCNPEVYRSTTLPREQPPHLQKGSGQNNMTGCLFRPSTHWAPFAAQTNPAEPVVSIVLHSTSI